jgi:CheY-like chemotaxis protein
MENARIVVFEDQARAQDLFKKILTQAGHEVIATAQTRADAIRAVNEADFDVAVVDGNLDAFDEDCSDGRAITEEIRKQKHGAKIVWFSSFEADKLGIDCDADSKKNFNAVIELIENF